MEWIIRQMKREIHPALLAVCVLSCLQGIIVGGLIALFVQQINNPSRNSSGNACMNSDSGFDAAASGSLGAATQ